MSNFINKLKIFFYSLPFGLKAADSEIMGSNVSNDGNDSTINQQVSDNRVAMHLLKGEVTKEVEELRYRTYKVCKESNKYSYIGNGLALKKDGSDDVNKNGSVIKFSQENKLICNDILSELNHINDYGVENYSVNINYHYPVRFKFQEFLTVVDVYIKGDDVALTTFHFNDERNPQIFSSKPFVGELEKLSVLFSNNDSYGLSRSDFVSSMMCMNFTTFNATDEQPDVITYTFINPELIDVKHESGEFKLTYKWGQHNIIDLAKKFFNYELEEKYKNKEKKVINNKTEISDNLFEEKIIKCSICGRDVNLKKEGYITNKDTGEPICMNCFYKKINNDGIE